jgi:hypothetical protein
MLLTLSEHAVQLLYAFPVILSCVKSDKNPLIVCGTAPKVELHDESDFLSHSEGAGDLVAAL